MNSYLSSDVVGKRTSPNGQQYRIVIDSIGNTGIHLIRSLKKVSHYSGGHLAKPFTAHLTVSDRYTSLLVDS